MQQKNYACATKGTIKKFMTIQGLTSSGFTSENDEEGAIATSNISVVFQSWAEAIKDLNKSSSCTIIKGIYSDSTLITEVWWEPVILSKIFLSKYFIEKKKLVYRKFFYWKICEKISLSKSIIESFYRKKKFICRKKSQLSKLNII